MIDASTWLHLLLLLCYWLKRSLWSLLKDLFLLDLDLWRKRFLGFFKGTQSFTIFLFIISSDVYVDLHFLCNRFIGLSKLFLLYVW
jgi:hypothetical protein